MGPLAQLAEQYPLKVTVPSSTLGRLTLLEQSKVIPRLTTLSVLWHYGEMKNVLLIVLWFPLTVALLIVNLTLLSSMAKAQKEAQAAKARYAYATNNILAQAGTSQVLGTSIEAGDARALLLSSFLKRHDSPMAPYAELLVHEAEANGLDYRLVVAIAMCESNLGKHMPSSDSFNPFGIAVYTGQTSGKKFTSWEHAITWVSQYIKEQFYDKGITDLRDIGAIWAPPSVNTGYSWTHCVESFKDSIL